MRLTETNTQTESGEHKHNTKRGELYTPPHILLLSLSNCSPGSNIWLVDLQSLDLLHCLGMPSGGAKNKEFRSKTTKP